MTSEPLLDLRFTLAEVPTARRRVAACVSQVGLDGSRSEDFVLAVHEVMSNAIRHGGGSGLLRMYRDDGMLRCEVTDHGPGLSQDNIPRTLPGLEAGESGRGLWLVHELTDSVTITANGHGTVVTLQIRLVTGADHSAAALAAHNGVRPAPGESGGCVVGCGTLSERRAGSAPLPPAR